LLILAVLALILYLIPVGRVYLAHWFDGLPLSNEVWVSQNAAQYPDVERYIVEGWHGPLYGDWTGLFMVIPLGLLFLTSGLLVVARLLLNLLKRRFNWICPLSVLVLQAVLLYHQTTLLWLYD